MSLLLALPACTEPIPVTTQDLVEPANDTGGGDCSEAPHADAVVGTREELVDALGRGGLVALLPGEYGTLDLTAFDARITGICRDRTRFTEVIGEGELRRLVIERYALTAGTGTLSEVVLDSVVSSGALRIDASTVVDAIVEGVALFSGTTLSGTVSVRGGQAAFVSGSVSGSVAVGDATVLLRSVTLTGDLASAGTLGITGGTLAGTLQSVGTTIVDGTFLEGGTVLVSGGTVDAEDLSSVDGEIRVDDGVVTVTRGAFVGSPIVVSGGAFSGNNLSLDGSPYALGVASEATCDDCAFTGEVGAVVAGGSLALTDPSFDVGGLGLWAEDATVVIDDGEVASGSVAGVWSEGGSLRVEGTGFQEARCLIVREGTELRADADFDHCAIGVLLDAATGDLTGSTFVGNPIDVWRQRCDGLAEPAGVSDANVTDCAGSIDLPELGWTVPP